VPDLFFEGEHSSIYIRRRSEIRFKYRQEGVEGTEWNREQNSGGRSAAKRRRVARIGD